MKSSKMRYALPLMLASLVLVGAGCMGSGNANVNADTGAERRPAPAAKPARELEVDMKALGTGGLSGKALLVEQNNKTKVMLNLTGDKSGTHPAHIHDGSCPTPGQVKYSLSDVVEGKSTTVVDVDFDTLVASMSNGLAINVHRSVTEIGVYISCGDLLAAKVKPLEAGAEEMMQAPNGSDASAGAGINANVNADVNAGGTVNVSLPKIIKVTAKQFSFEPAEIRVKLGDKVQLEIASTDVDHGIAMPAFNVNSVLKAGTTTTVLFTADKKGSYPFFCSVFCGSGHGSMRGTLIVE